LAHKASSDKNKCSFYKMKHFHKVVVNMLTPWSWSF